MKVLVAEDNFFTAKQYTTALKKRGHSVIVTKDGKECLEKYREASTKEFQQEGFDVILLDNNMPEKSGVDVAKKILDKDPNQRIIFASAYNIDSLKESSQSLKNAVEIMQKPFSLSAMVAKIEGYSA